MGHTHRVEVPGGLYHVTSRGNAREAIFRDDVDCVEFLRMLATVAASYGWLVRSYCLLPNHWHFLLWPLSDGDLGVFMQKGS